jgi:Trk-type K+ transport system membrane component
MVSLLSQTSVVFNQGADTIREGYLPFDHGRQYCVSLFNARRSYLIVTNANSYPIILRSFLWLLHQVVSTNEERRDTTDTIQFILNYPRRVYTNIFPSAHTWWLLFVLIFFTAIDWASFELLNARILPMTAISLPFREAAEFFQSISIRSAGFSIFPVSQLAIGTQIITLVMMYISAYPVLITLRSSNVYERSLGIFRDQLKMRSGSENGTEDGVRKTTRGARRFFFLRQQLQHQLAHDIWWLTISAVVIVCLEADNNSNDPVTYSIFNMIFEVVSAYGPVGLSTGLPNAPYSLSGGFRTISKVLICSTMIRGRHRGLPVAIDKAVLLPGEISDRREVTARRMHGAGVL